MTTDDMMTLRVLLKNSSDADPIREMVGFTAERLMELESIAQTGDNVSIKLSTAAA